MRRIHRALIAVVACAWLISVKAQPLAERIPSDAILYVGWAGTEKLEPAYSKSHLKGVLDHSSLPQLLAGLGPNLVRRLEAEGALKGEEMKDLVATLLSVGEAAWRKPTALYLGPLDYSGKQPMPKVALFCDAGKDAAALSAKIGNVIAKIPPEAPLKIRNQVWGGTLLVVSTFDLGERIEESLSQREQFVNAMKQGRPDPAFALFFDSEKVVNVVSMGINMGADDKTKTLWRNILVTTGIAGMRRLVYTGGFDGADWTTQAFIEAPIRMGLLSTLLDAQPLPDDLLKQAPKSSTWLAATRFDLAKTVTDIRNAVARLEPEASRGFELILAEINKLAGMDLQKDLLAHLGDQWLVYNSPETGQGLMGMVLVSPLRDAAKAEAAMIALEQKINAAIPKPGEHNPITISIQTTKVDDLTIHYLAVPVVSPCWTIKNNNLYVALFPQILATAAQRNPTPGDSILANESFQAARKRLGVENAISLSYFDLPSLAPRGYQMILALQQAATGLLDMFGMETPAMALPPLNRITPHLSPSTASTWIDEKGWHYRGTSPFPAADLFAGEQALVTTAAPVLAGVALPAITKARHQATAVAGMNNLRQIGLAAIMYAQDKQDQLPPDLGSLLPYLHAPQVFIAPARMSTVQIPSKQEELAAWVNQNSDYVYLGAALGKLGAIPNTAQTVLAHEKFEMAQNGLIQVLYVDGHVERLPVQVLRQQLEQQGKPRGL